MNTFITLTLIPSRSLQARKETREKAWEVDGWADTVDKTSQLAKHMDSFILTPLSFSPLK